jgi:2-hydroxy-3-keto-5-methylthiopentenyl-1-phosphate phosphatase
MDLARAAVFLDFDGTVTLEDTGVYLLEQLAPDEWLQVEDDYVAGRIGSKECIRREWAMLPPERARVEATVAEVGIDPGFFPLVAYLRDRGAEVCILSDGFGFRAEEVAAEAGVAVITNAIEWMSWTVVFPNEATDCECAECGACKRAPIRKSRALGRTTVLVGDGASDVKGASVADVIFAKDDLAKWCESNGVAFEPFSSLADVQQRLEQLSA